MKKVFSTILIVILSAPTLVNIGVLLDYVVRYQTYVEELCENRNRPELHCNGKCQLAELQVSNEDPVEPIKPNLNNLEIKVVFHSEAPTVEIPFQILLQGYPLYREHFLSNALADIPTPPPRV